MRRTNGRCANEEEEEERVEKRRSSEGDCSMRYSLPPPLGIEEIHEKKKKKKD